MTLNINQTESPRDFISDSGWSSLIGGGSWTNKSLEEERRMCVLVGRSHSQEKQWQMSLTWQIIPPNTAIS